MYKNILVPIVLDGSRDTANSLDVAQTLADDDAAITLIHVIEAVPAYVADYIPPDFLPSKRAELLEQLTELARGLPSGRGVVVDGRTGPRIEQWAEENETDCIIIASHEPGLADLLLGSVAHHVVRHAKCSVHVLR